MEALLLNLTSLVLFAMAAACSAIMDNISFHWEKSIFNNPFRFSEKWWNPSVSWKNKYDPKYFILGIQLIWFSDAWHFFKSLSITLICISCSICLLCPFSGDNISWISELHSVFKAAFAIAAYGFTWNASFNLFFDRILNRKA